MPFHRDIKRQGNGYVPEKTRRLRVHPKRGRRQKAHGKAV